MKLSLFLVTTTAIVLTTLNSCKIKSPTDDGKDCDSTATRNFALSFDGVDDYIIFHDVMPNLGNNSSWSAWIYVTEFPDDQYNIVGKGGRGQLEIQKNGKVTVFDYLGGKWVSAADPMTVPLKKWVHYAGTIASSTNSTTLSLYRNGCLVAQNKMPYLTEAHPGCNLYIGGSKVPFQDGPCFFTHTQAFAGLIDEVNIWNRAITEEEVKLVYNLKLTGKESGLVGYWKFEEGEGLSAKDETINGLTAELLYGPQWSKVK